MPGKIVKQLKTGKGRGTAPAKPSTAPGKTNVKTKGPLPKNPTTGNPPNSGGQGAEPNGPNGGGY